MRPNQIRDLAAGRPADEPADDPTILDQDERRKLCDFELARERWVAIHIDIDHPKAPLLGHLDPGHEALHASGCARLSLAEEQERRETWGRLDRPGCRLRCLSGSHSRGVPLVHVLETAGVSSVRRSGTPVLDNHK